MRRVASSCKVRLASLCRSHQSRRLWPGVTRWERSSYTANSSVIQPPPPSRSIRSDCSSTAAPTADHSSAKPSLVHLKATVEYFGPDFHGFAACPHTPITVQAILQSALQRCIRATEPINITAAGRTDTGVHALANVCSLSLPASTVQRLGGVQRLLFIWNQAIYHLRRERSLHVIALQRVTAEFHARHSAVQRRYLYRIVSGGYALFERERAWHVPEQLDVAAMEAAAAELLNGMQDFRALVSHRRTDPRPTTRFLSALTIQAYTYNQPLSHTPPPQPLSPAYHNLTPHHPSTLLHVHYTAPSFLHHQVRNLTALLVQAGRHRLTPVEVRALLDSGRGRQWNPIGTAPAHGLWLAGIDYRVEDEKRWLLSDSDAAVSASDVVGGVVDSGDAKQAARDRRTRQRGDERWVVNDSGKEDDYILKIVKR